MKKDELTMSKIYFATKAYNAEKTISRCIESVLNQTQYGEDIVYYICNNGSTDKTGDIINEYANKDKRIKVFNNKENHVYNEETQKYENLRHTIGADDYFCALDADDAYELNFLEKMIPFMQSNELDIAACGYNYIDGKTDEIIDKRTIDGQLFATNAEEFSNYYHLYHQFMRPVWGKIFTGKVARKSFVRETLEADKKLLGYGSDTLITFSMLKNAGRIGVLPDLLHNYYIYEKSVSHQYNSQQSDSDIILFNDAIDFLSQYGEISAQNLHFTYMVYLSAIKDTVKNLVNSKLSAEEKLKEYLKIFARVETQDVLLIKNKSIDNVRYELLKGVLSFATDLKKFFDKVHQIFEILSPNCCLAVNKDTIKLFARNDNFKALLFKDDKNLLSEYLLTLVLNNDKLTKVYDFPLMLGNLASENSLASTIKNTEFIRLYTDAYSLIWNSQNSEALSEMTEILFSGNELNCAEDFLNLYVTLAALENHVEAFLFGNIQKAYLFIDEKRFDEARKIVNDLVEMGAGESEDVIEILKTLEK